MYNASSSENYSLGSQARDALIEDITGELMNEYQRALGSGIPLPVAEYAFFVNDLVDILDNRNVGLMEYPPYLDFVSNMEGLNALRLDEMERFNSNAIVLPERMVTEANNNYSSADIIFSDDFESEPHGELPSQWTVRYSGNTLETVSSPVYAGNRAFMLQGAPSWVGSVTHDIDIQGDFVLEAYVYIPSGGLGRENQGGIAYNDCYMVKFTKNSSSTFQLGCRGTSYGSYSCNTWFKIELRVDSESERFKVYLDGNYVLTENAGNSDSRGIELSASNLNDAGAQRTVYFDNIKVTCSSFSY